LVLFLEHATVLIISFEKEYSHCRCNPKTEGKVISGLSCIHYFFLSMVRGGYFSTCLAFYPLGYLKVEFNWKSFVAAYRKHIEVQECSNLNIGLLSRPFIQWN